MTLGSQLTTLEASYLIQLEASIPDLSYVFRHVLVRDAVYATLVRRERSLIHQAVGDALEALYLDQAESQSLAPRLGAHFAEAGDWPRALKYFVLAADRAAQQYANQEAAQYYGRALEIARTQPEAPLARLYLARGQALELCGDYGQALAGYEEMEAQAHERQDETLALEALVAQVRVHMAFSTVSSPARGRAALERALALAARRSDGRAEARLLLYGVRLHTWSRDTPQVIRAGEQAVASARRYGPPQLLAEGLIQLANWGYVNNLQLRLAREKLEEAEALLRGLEAPQLRLERLLALFQVLYISGDFERALGVIDEIGLLSTAMDYGWGLSQYHSFLGIVHLEQGNLQAAIPNLEAAIELGRQFSVGQRELIVCAFLSRAYAAVGEGGLALSQVQQAHAFLAEQMPFVLTWALGAEAVLQLAAGDVTAASELIAQVQAVPGQRNIITYRMLGQAEAELALAQADYARVLSLTDEMIGKMRAEGGCLALSEALTYRGRALLAAGDLEPARTALLEARALAEEMGLAPILWQVLAALAELETQQGDLAAANSLRDQAREVIMKLAEQTGTPARRAGFLARREVQAVLLPAG